METLEKINIESQKFADDVLNGLRSNPKKLPSKYLYDERGSNFFEEIMDLPEYYPTRCECELLDRHKKEILEYCRQEDFYIADLGAGNGMKAMLLINYFLGRADFKYIPIDISKTVVNNLIEKLRKKFPQLKTEGLIAEYPEGLNTLKGLKDIRKFVLFLGSNIGNFRFKEALHFLKDLNSSLNKGDLFLIGFDLRKDPRVIRQAYNDSRGVTAKFNLNLLRRINEELDGDFDIDKFMYYPIYEPITGEMKSFLISKEKQEVFIKKLNYKFELNAWETIHTECSNKYDEHMIRELATKTGFSIENNFYDSKKYFVDSLWKVR